MVVEGVNVERTPQAYFRWVASAPDTDVRARGPTPATALHHLYAALHEDATADSDPETTPAASP